ncbi:MAG: malonyl-CoA/methylmalonyl-CoA synthetase [Frankiaceae bacterium]|nr:malonyl-CoA/methylmalonyl-CoA synthetase [Frankiaceae bacterium]
MLLTALRSGCADVTVRGRRLHGQALADAVGAVSRSVAGHERVAVVAEPALETVVAVAGVLAGGGCAIPLNPAAGELERDHVLRESAPSLVLTPGDVDLTARAELPDEQPLDAQPALVVFTSGTTGPPKGAVISRRAVGSCLDGLAGAWNWSDDDVLAHALPLFHVHGLVLGTLGPLRHGSPVVIRAGFGPVPGATMYFAVPTMWSRASDAELSAMRPARMLVSGSAALPARVFERVRDRSGHALVERYGLTESLIVTAARLSDDRSPGRVGRPLDAVRLRIDGADDDGMGEVLLSGPTLFSGYLNQPGATATAMTNDGWLRTGDLGSYDDDNGLRLYGRLATDLIKTGGFKVGAGEVEDALLAHPALREAAVTGEPDDDLGERIVAWVVTGAPVEAQALVDHVAQRLAPHKRPREVRFVEALPRNAMGKIQKTLLR